MCLMDFFETCEINLCLKTLIRQISKKAKISLNIFKKNVKLSPRDGVEIA